MISAVTLCMAILSLNTSADRKDLVCSHMGYIIEQSRERGIDPTLTLSVMYVESRFSTQAESKDRKARTIACGLMQVIPKFAKYKKNGKRKTYTCEQLKEPRTGVRAGLKMLARWIKLAGNVDHGLCAYWAGLNGCKKFKDPERSKYTLAVREIQKKIIKEIKEMDE